jgi:hypothetical protein
VFRTMPLTVANRTALKVGGHYSWVPRLLGGSPSIFPRNHSAPLNSAWEPVLVLKKRDCLWQTKRTRKDFQK